MLTENLYAILEDKARQFVGLNFTDAEIRRCREDQGYALALGLASNVNCNIKCKFCFTDTHNNKGPQISIEKRLDILAEARDIGVRTVITGGSGEPFSDRDFPTMVETAIGYGMDYVVFSNLTLITPDRAKWLHDLQRVGVFGGIHSHKPDVYEGMTQVQGSFARMMRGAENLLDAGFATHNFAVTTVVGKPNCDELEAITEYWADRGIMVYPEYCNITGTAEYFRDELYLPYSTYDAKLTALRSRLPGYTGDAPLLTSGKKCFTGEYAIIIGINGQVKTCFDPGPKGELGSIHDMSLRQAISKKYANPCFCDGYDACLGRNLFLPEEQRRAEVPKRSLTVLPG